MHYLRQPKVDYFYICVWSRCRKKEILWFQVAMHDVHRVAIVERLEDLLEYLSCDFFREVLILNNQLKELTSGAQPEK